MEPSHRFILKNASNKTIKHITGAREAKISDHLLFFDKICPLIDSNVKIISAPIIKTTRM